MRLDTNMNEQVAPLTAVCDMPLSPYGLLIHLGAGSLDLETASKEDLAPAAGVTRHYRLGVEGGYSLHLCAEPNLASRTPHTISAFPIKVEILTS